MKNKILVILALIGIALVFYTCSRDENLNAGY